MKNLQQAADDAGTIAETVETLHKLLDRFYACHSQESCRKLEAAWPDSYGLVSAKKLYELARSLTPGA